MTLEVEDGTAKSTAESYISVTDADTYAANRNYTAWAALNTTQKEANLRLATDFLTEYYRDRWKGWRVSVHQALDWPRQGVQITDTYQGAIGYYQLDFTTVPPEVKHACAEMALRAMSGDPLLPDLTPLPARETVGPISVEWSTARMPRDKQTAYPAIDRLLSQLLVNGANNVMLYRA